MMATETFSAEADRDSILAVIDSDDSLLTSVGGYLLKLAGFAGGTHNANGAVPATRDFTTEAIHAPPGLFVN